MYVILQRFLMDIPWVRLRKFYVNHFPIRLNPGKINLGLYLYLCKLAPSDYPLNCHVCLLEDSDHIMIERKCRHIIAPLNCLSLFTDKYHVAIDKSWQLRYADTECQNEDRTACDLRENDFTLYGNQTRNVVCNIFAEIGAILENLKSRKLSGCLARIFCRRARVFFRRLGIIQQRRLPHLNRWTRRYSRLNFRKC